MVWTWMGAKWKGKWKIYEQNFVDPKYHSRDGFEMFQVSFDTILRPRFRTLPTWGSHLDKEIFWPFCACKRSRPLGDLIVSHNATKIAEDALLSPVLVKKRILGSAPPWLETWPSLWEAGRTLAGHYRDELRQRVDGSRRALYEAYVRKSTTRTSRTESHLRHRRRSERSTARAKPTPAPAHAVRLYAPSLEHSSYCGRIWSRLSCVLQR